MRARWWGVAVATILGVGCGGAGSGATGAGDVSPLALLSEGDLWRAPPVTNALSTVSNNGAGYTGETHAYELTLPATGRLQLSLTWDQNADYDLIVSDAPGGGNHLAKGVLGSNEPEYVGLPVEEGQVLWVLVAGWEGEAGEYTLEVVLLPPEAPAFAPEPVPVLLGPAARNRPLEFRFTVALDPAQVPEEHLILLTTGHRAEGLWAIEGPVLRFFPRLPVTPDDPGGLRDDCEYVFQVPRGAHGLRAVTGEHLSTIVTEVVEIRGLAPPPVAGPLRVVGIDPGGEPFQSGESIEVRLSSALDPWTVDGSLRIVDDTDGEESVLPTRLVLRQPDGVLQTTEATLTIEPVDALPPDSHIRLRLPGTLVALGETDPALGGLTTGPDSPAGQGFVLDFHTP